MRVDEKKTSNMHETATVNDMKPNDRHWTLIFNEYPV